MQQLLIADSPNAPKAPNPEYGSYRAYFYVTLSNFSFVLMQLFFKQLTQYFSANLVLGVRGSLLFLFNLINLRLSGLDFHIRDPTSTH